MALLRLLSILYKTYFFLIFALSLVLLYPFFYWHLVVKNNHQSAFNLKKLWAYFLFYGSFNRIQISGKEHLSKGDSHIICPNHSSYFDIIAAYIAFDTPFVFMGKAELLKWPLFRIFFKYMDIAVNRSSPTGAARAMIKSKQALEKGYSLILFPEGTISKQRPTLSHFKPGAFKLATEINKPVIPVTFNGNWKVINVQSLGALSLPRKIRVDIHPPIHSNAFDSIPKFAAATKQQIETTLWK